MSQNFRVTCTCAICQRVVARAHAERPWIPNDRFRPPCCGHVVPLVRDYWGQGICIVIGVESVAGTLACNIIGGKMEENCAFAAAVRECWEETGFTLTAGMLLGNVAMSGNTAVLVADFGNLSKDRVMNPRGVSRPELSSVEYLRLTDMRVLRRVGNIIHVVDMPVSRFVANVCADLCSQMGLNHSAAGVTVVG